MTAQGWRVIRQGATALSGNPGEVVSEGFIAQAVQQLTHKGDKDAADMLYQMYLTQMQQMSMRKHFIHRKGTAGYSQDALRGFGWNMTRLANQIAKLEHVPTLERLLGEIESDMKEAQRSADGVDATVANHLFKELTLRHQWIMSPDNHPLTNIAAALGFIYYVSPAAALVNLTQTAIVAYPVLASRYGWQGAGTALTTALLDVARGFSPIVVKGFLTGRPLPSQAANLSDEERAAFTAWNSSGIRDRTQAHNLAGIGDSDNFLNGPVFNRTMAIISSGFHAAEVVNRDATLLAAYRLARAAGTGHEQAITEAEEATWTAHFDYANANRARMMQGNWAKVLLMFKSYSQHMLYFLGRNLYLATRGESPEVQRAARVQLGGVLGMTGLFAGALGLPLVGTLFSVMNLVAATFGDDDDPWDTETEFRNWLAATFPASVAGIIDGGAVSTLTGLDWHSRVGLDGLVWRSPDRDLNGAGTFAYVVEQLLGPFGGMLAQPFTAVDLIADGQWQRAAEAIAPKFLRDPLRAGRYAAEGVLTKIGEPVVERERLSTYELLWKALGMNPAQIAVQYEANAAVKLYESRILERRQQLQAAYAMAYLHGESAALPKIQAQITAFNRAQPTIPISPSTLRAAIRGRQRAALETTHGIRVNRRLEQVRDVGAFGG
jgi:hypothetical protein